MIANPRRKPRRGRLRDPKYLAWIRDLGCVACMGSGAFLRLLRDEGTFSDYSLLLLSMPHSRAPEAAHVGLRGLAQKCSDRETIPLCAAHHRTGKDSHHVLGKKFWEHHGLDKAKLIAELNARYEEERAAA